MMKKGLLVLVLVAVVASGAFAQDFEEMPKNTITVDFGPTIAGSVIKGMLDMMSSDEDGVSASGFGIALQYERQLNEKLSVGFRFAYLGCGMGYSSTEYDDDNDVEIKGSLKVGLSSFSLEGHARFYPGDTFFLDGMLGYANLTADISGKMAGEKDGVKETISLSVNAPRSYLKLGAKIGWRIDFGDPGGFIFEPSFGYYAGIGVGDTIGKTIASKFGAGEEVDTKDFDDLFQILENAIFIGGPRLCLSFGWRF